MDLWLRRQIASDAPISTMITSVRGPEPTFATSAELHGIADQLVRQPGPFRHGGSFGARG
jgi:hypothetical protein